MLISLHGELRVFLFKTSAVWKSRLSILRVEHQENKKKILKFNEILKKNTWKDFVKKKLSRG